jgi:hypothetical protein
MQEADLEEFPIAENTEDESTAPSQVKVQAQPPLEMQEALEPIQEFSAIPDLPDVEEINQNEMPVDETVQSPELPEMEEEVIVATEMTPENEEPFILQEAILQDAIEEPVVQTELPHEEMTDNLVPSIQDEQNLEEPVETQPLHEELDSDEDQSPLQEEQVIQPPLERRETKIEEKVVPTNTFRKRKIETVEPVPMMKRSIEEEPTDPLKELEKFRRQLMNQFKRNAKMTQLQKTFDLLGVNIEPFYELPEEESSEFLETLRIEMETNSISLGALLKKFVRYIRFISDFEMPTHFKISAETLERLVDNPGQVFKALNHHYFECREKHERTTEFTFSTREEVRLSEREINLVFEVHKNEVQEVCAAFIPCALVTEEERRVPLAA